MDQSYRTSATTTPAQRAWLDVPYVGLVKSSGPAVFIDSGPSLGLRWLWFGGDIGEV